MMQYLNLLLLKLCVGSSWPW